MNHSPLVSIIVLNFNGEPYITKCLDSLLNQTYTNIELIVVDNASTDGSMELLRRYIPKIKLICNSKNLGFAAGNNVAIRVAKGDLIALFNNDAYADKKWLTHLVEGLLRAPQAGIVGGPIYYSEPNNLIWCTGCHYDILTGLSWHLGQYETKVTLPKDFDYLCGCAFLFRREVVNKIGLLDERFFLYCEEIDFCLRTKNAGYILLFVPEAITWHAISVFLKKNAKFGNYLLLKSEFKLMLKTAPWYYKPWSILFRAMAMPFFECLFMKYPFSRYTETWHSFLDAVKETITNNKTKPDDKINNKYLHIRLFEGFVVMLKRGKIMTSNPKTKSTRIRSLLHKDGK